MAFKYSLLSISTVVYSASCIYNSEEITFQKALTVALKVQKRLAFTMVCQVLLTNSYTFVTTIIVFFLSKQNQVQFEKITVILIIILLVFGIILALFMTISWQLANIITVMDDYSGFKAMKKSKQLIKGNYGTAIALLLVLSICCSPMFILAKQLVGIDSNFGVGPIILYGIISLVFNPVIMLFCLVVQTMFYFVCKAYHHESIDISSFVDCLDLSKSDGEYFPLKSESKKIDQLDV
ncbi:uncharacterized protein LOC141600654 [Silene latifolia]|uniref:uncharacterized protein LOC141600654 n=1 Tax=Silene latifolia TaxID=37657 RepID=UPI003D77F426